MGVPNKCILRPTRIVEKKEYLVVRCVCCEAVHKDDMSAGALFIADFDMIVGCQLVLKLLVRESSVDVFDRKMSVLTP